VGSAGPIRAVSWCTLVYEWCTPGALESARRHRPSSSCSGVAQRGLILPAVSTLTPRFGPGWPLPTAPPTEPTDQHEPRCDRPERSCANLER
jgi:hypothetical protein